MGRIPLVCSLAIGVLSAACGGGPEPPVLDDAFPIPDPAGDNVLGPRLSRGGDGTVLLSWMRRGESGATLRFSELDADRWGPAVDVVSDTSMFVNWADLPSVRPLGENAWVAHWLSKSGPAVYAYDVQVAFSTDRGNTWGPAFKPHDDGTETEHGFVSIYPVAGAAALLWLDGRKTINEPSDDPSATSMTLRSAVVEQDGARRRAQLVDDVVCDCCQTDVAVAADGPIAVYRDRSLEEIRDIYVTRFRDGSWQPGEAIADDGWQIAGCPVNGPAIDALDDTVAIAWFSAANNRTVVRAAISTNGGRSFKEPVEVAATRASGHVGVAIVDRRSAVVSWVESDKRGTHAIKVRSVTSAGLLGAPQVVGRSELKRIYPQMVRSNDLLILAWTDKRNDRTRLASVKVPILGFYER